MSPVRFSRSTTLRSLAQILVLLTVPYISAGCGRLSLSRSGEAAGQHDDEPKMDSLTIAGENLELFMEHPYLVQGQPVKSNVHLTVLKDGMPIRSGKLTMVATGPLGTTVKTEQAAPKSPGIFGPVLAFPETGENKVALTLQSDQAEETIRVAVIVYADEAGA